MSNEQEIKEKFWKALKSDMTMFLGLAEGEDGHARPMTAQLDDEDQDGEHRGNDKFQDVLHVLLQGHILRLIRRFSFLALIRQ